MDFGFTFTKTAIGPVWPAMLLYLAFMVVTTLFIFLAWLRSHLRAYNLRELRFLQRLYDATETVSSLAILTGMIGTCLGLVDVLPVLAKIPATNGGSSFLAQVLSPLQNIWVSTISGLALGGLWGESLIFFLKPYTRPALLPVSYEPPPEDLDQNAPPEEFDDDSYEPDDFDEDR